MLSKIITASIIILSLWLSPMAIVPITLWIIFSTQGNTTNTIIVMGSGGHTTEMISYLSTAEMDVLEKRFYMIAETDTGSESKVVAFEESVGGAVGSDYEVVRIKRSREVGQSYVSSVWTTVKAILYCFVDVARIRPRVLLMNGPGTCVPVCLCCWMLKIFGLTTNLKMVLMETYACIYHPSLTTKILRKFVDLLCVQWPELLKMYPESVYVGRLNLENDVEEGENVQCKNNTVLVTVGSTKHENLIESIDQEDIILSLIGHGYTEIHIQKGNGDYVPTNIQHLGADIKIFDYMPSLLDEIRWADLIITHAGTGTIFECLSLSKRVIAVPNTLLMNNHQIEIADLLDTNAYLVHSECQTLKESIERAVSFSPRTFPSRETDEFRNNLYRIISEN